MTSSTNRPQVPPRRRRFKPAPAPAFAKLRQWVEAADKGEAPDNSLILDALSEWQMRGLAKVDPIGPGRAIFRCSFKKPRQGRGESVRDMDPAGIALIMVLCSAGGTATLDPQGPEGQFFYPRIIIPGERPGGTIRRTQMLAIIADTPTGTRAQEPADHHSLRRQDLCVRDSKAGEARSLSGAETAKKDALGWVREVHLDAPERLPPGLADCFPALLDAALRVLRKLPLKDEPAAVPA